LLYVQRNHQRSVSHSLRIHITGASGTGTTTLGRALAAELNCPHFDTDDYFWQPTDPPYQQKRDLEERSRLLLADLEAHPRWVLSGSIGSWGDFAIPLFNLVIFLRIPTELRLERLARREYADFGDAILPGGTMHQIYTEFMEWAARYDTAGLEQRSLKTHEQWLDQLPCPILRLEGDMPVDERVRRTIQTINSTYQTEQTRL
jgi:adenylate kinase family enzyme